MSSLTALSAKEHSKSVRILRSYSERLEQLNKLLRLIDENEEALAEALHKDLGKPRFEAVLGEINFVRAEVEHTKKHLKIHNPIGLPYQPKRQSTENRPSHLCLHLQYSITSDPFYSFHPR